jgi:hypothetical protein
MAIAGKPKETTVIEVSPPEVGEVEVGVLGLTPYIANRLSEKAKHELLVPRGPRNNAERKATLKHEPLVEFNSAPYVLEEGPTRLAVPAAAFKKAMMSAAVDLPDASKAQIGRLVWVQGYRLPMFGIPKLFMAIVRQAGIQGAPDVRTRALLPAWGCRLSIRFLMPNLTEKAIVNLLSTAGFTIGVGDWRPEKGSGTFGQFRLCELDDPDFLKVTKDGARKAQVKAMEVAEPYDTETAELLEWAGEEIKRRGR